MLFFRVTNNNHMDTNLGSRKPQYVHYLLPVSEKWAVQFFIQ